VGRIEMPTFQSTFDFRLSTFDFRLSTLKLTEISFACQFGTVYIFRLFETHGELAQLGERLNGIQEVSGSIPLFSTNKIEIKIKIEIRLGDGFNNL
jgi:hypothetical protein